MSAVTMKKFLIILQKEQKEKLYNNHEKTKIKDTFNAIVTIMIINYFEENFNGNNCFWKIFAYEQFINKLIDCYRNEIVLYYDDTIYYNKVKIDVYNIWKKIEKEYINNY